MIHYVLIDIYYQTEGAFSQPNATVCQSMIEWAITVTKEYHFKTDLLELYCGGGTFTIPVSNYFNKVLATEMNKTSVILAHQAIKENNIINIKIIRLSSEDFTLAYTKKRVFNRLQQQNIQFSNYNLQTVLVDPPRSGLDNNTCYLLQKFTNIVYISCNPETLSRDLVILTKSHDVANVACFDQFPYTHHLGK